MLRLCFTLFKSVSPQRPDLFAIGGKLNSYVHPFEIQLHIRGLPLPFAEGHEANGKLRDSSML
jgi:hypothetical protein